MVPASQLLFLFDFMHGRNKNVKIGVCENQCLLVSADFRLGHHNLEI